MDLTCEPTDLRPAQREKTEKNRELASQFSDPLSSGVPPYSQSAPGSSSVSSASNVPGTDAAYDGFLEPIVKIEFEENPFLNLSGLWHWPLGIQAC